MYGIAKQFSRKEKSGFKFQLKPAIMSVSLIISVVLSRRTIKEKNHFSP